MNARNDRANVAFWDKYRRIALCFENLSQYNLRKCGVMIRKALAFFYGWLVLFIIGPAYVDDVNVFICLYHRTQFDRVGGELHFSAGKFNRFLRTCDVLDRV